MFEVHSLENYEKKTSRACAILIDNVSGNVSFVEGMTHLLQLMYELFQNLVVGQVC